MIFAGGRLSWHFPFLSRRRRTESSDSTERFVVVPGGIRLFVRTYPGNGPQLPVFCLHGLTRNSADFDGIAPFIAAQGRTVHAMDVRGRGRSDRDPDPSHYRPDIYATDVLRVLDALDVRKAVGIGTSMGGIITMLLAAQAPERIGAAVLNDVGPVLEADGLVRIGRYAGQIGPYASWQALTEAIKATQAVAFPHATEAFWRTFARRVARERPDGSVILDYDPAVAEVFKQPTGAAPGVLDVLFTVLARKPILVLRGALSDILAPRGVEAMRRLNPDLEVIEVPGVGHAPTLDEPAARNAIQKFLSRVP
ncbi:MAG: alpha/beta hydrolase [Alphaproteobacteria bacterium]|nr:alpha/beta hydrolase [Alphaproteobacteria bacterium]MDE2112104.1 alpha/beta hydrolase [Alphaproteobacteria bacterium]MDE2493902.1 alpha/beta hydrolase [Alphaproteobacteria bacterium]